MVEWHIKKGITPTGARYRANRRKDKTLAEKGGIFSATRVDEEETVTYKKRNRGGSFKGKIKISKEINVVDPATKEIKKATLKAVEENPANRLFSRRNIITKGALVETDIGMVRVTSRPGQTASLHGVLIKE